MSEQNRAIDLLHAHRQHARVSPHVGTAAFQLDGTTYTGTAEFLLPPSGDAIIAFHTDMDLTSQDFATDLVIEGDGEHGPFRVDCPRCYVRVSKVRGQRATLISPINAPGRIRYGTQRAAQKAIALLNDFDYRHGDFLETEHGHTRIGTPFSVEAGGRRIVFRHRPEHDELLALVRARLLRSASVVEIGFDLSAEETDDQALDFSINVAALCTFASGTGVSVAMLELQDDAGAPVRRIIPQPVTSRYRAFEIVEDDHLPQLFSETLAEHIRMKESHAPWHKLRSYCGSLEDSPFLEQKFASLMMAIEYFIRNSLLEHGLPAERVASLDFPKLIGAARKELSWDVPKHYMAKEAVRLLRNAVMHGDELPTADSAEFRRHFDKWRLFLFRRVLIRLGYTGQVVSPHKGWASGSAVGDFSEEHNCFKPADPNAPDPLRELARLVREHNARAAVQ